MARGGNFFKKAWNGIKKANSWLRKTKVISNVGQHIPVYGDKIAKVAKTLGYGKKHKRIHRRHRRGSGWLKDAVNKAKNLNKKFREKRYISRYSRLATQTLDDLGKMSGNKFVQNAAKMADKITNTAGVLGYGKGGKRLKMNGGARLNVNGGSSGDQARTLNLVSAKAQMFK